MNADDDKLTYDATPISTVYNWLNARFAEAYRAGDESAAAVYAELSDDLEKAVEKYHNR